MAEHLAATGVIDGVVAAEDLPAMVDLALAVLVDPPGPGALPRREGGDRVGERSAWESVERTRLHERAGVRDLLAHGASGTVQLRGTDEGERDSTVMVALTRLDDQPCVVVGQDRSRQAPGHAMGPGALREARRGMRLAEELGLPLVTVIDTPGAELSPQAEERAIAGEIARCIATLTTMKVPTVSVILGEGCGGGALALLPAQTVIATEHAWLSPLPPEGASVIVHGDTAHAAEMAARQRVKAADLLADGVVHHVVPEVDGESARDLALAVAAEIGARLRGRGGWLTPSPQPSVHVDWLGGRGLGEGAGGDGRHDHEGGDRDEHHLEGGAEGLGGHPGRLSGGDLEEGRAE